MVKNIKTKVIKYIFLRYITFILFIFKKEYSKIQHKLNYYIFQSILDNQANIQAINKIF